MISLQLSLPQGHGKNYIAAVEGAGARPVAGYCPAPDPNCDGLILCGGEDLDWTLFARENQGSQPPDLERDRAELALCRAFLAAGIRLPGPLAIAFDDVAAMIGPLSMIITGMVVGSMNWKEMTGNRRIWLVLLFRMVIGSGIAVAFVVLTGIPYRIPSGRSIVMITLLSAIAPSASNINQVAILYGKDEKYASAINVLSTLSCILTMPFWILVYETLIP